MTALTAARLWAIPRVGAPQPLPDGSAVVPVTTYDLEANQGTTRLWRISAEPGEATPLTRGDLNATQPAVSPSGGRLSFLRPVDGRNQLHLMPLDGGEPEQVSDLPLGVLAAKWLPDESGLVLAAYLYLDHLTPEETAAEHKRREASKVTARVTEHATYRYWDTWLTGGEVLHLFRLDLATRTLTDLTPDSTRFWHWPSVDDLTADFDVDPDGKEIAFVADRSTPPHRHLRWALFTVPVEGGETRLLTPDNPGHLHRPRYTPDGSLLVYGMQREPDFYGDRVRIVVLDRASGDHRVLTEEWDRSAGQWETTADGLLLTAEDEGRSPLFRLDLELGGTPRLCLREGTLSSPRPAPDGSVWLSHHSLHQPPEAARVTPQGELVRVSRFTVPALEGIDLVPAEELWVEGGRGDPVQVFVVPPPAAESTPPLVHMIHGGPHAVSGDGWHWRWNAQVLASAGYLVAMVNFHGSSSFGQEFASCILGRWGELPAADIEAATDHLVAAGRVDPERMAVTGGSYGGYLTAWITTCSDRYACAVAHAAVTDFPGMYASDITLGRRRMYGAELWEDPEKVLAWSPNRHAAGYSTPTLVVHGERDFRVPVSQGLELYGILQAKGVEARLVYYPDENHWVLSPANSIHWYGEVLGWLARHLE